YKHTHTHTHTRHNKHTRIDTVHRLLYSLSHCLIHTHAHTHTHTLCVYIRAYILTHTYSYTYTNTNTHTLHGCASPWGARSQRILLEKHIICGHSETLPLPPQQSRRQHSPLRP